MENPEISYVDWTNAFLILALVLIVLPFVLPVVLCVKSADSFMSLPPSSCPSRLAVLQ